MPTLPTNSRNAAADAVADLIDGGSTNPNGTITFTTGGGTPTTLLTLQLSNPAAGNAATGVVTFNPITANNPVANGTAAEAFIQNRDGSDVITGLTVGLSGSGSDIEFSSVTWTTALTIGLSQLTLTMPAS